MLAPRHKGQQLAYCVSVAAPRVRSQIALADQVLQQESANPRPQRAGLRHGWSPRGRIARSVRWQFHEDHAFALAEAGQRTPLTGQHRLGGPTCECPTLGGGAQILRTPVGGVRNAPNEPALLQSIDPRGDVRRGDGQRACQTRRRDVGVFVDQREHGVLHRPQLERSMDSPPQRSAARPSSHRAHAAVSLALAQPTCAGCLTRPIDLGGDRLDRRPLRRVLVLGVEDHARGTLDQLGGNFGDFLILAPFSIEGASSNPGRFTSAAPRCSSRPHGHQHRPRRA